MASRAAVAAVALAMSDEINEALILYTGFGASPFPRARTAVLVARFGESAGRDLKRRIVALLDEVQQPVEVPERRSAKSYAERAIEQFAARHPELDESGLKAVAWTYSFGFR